METFRLFMTMKTKIDIFFNGKLLIKQRWKIKIQFNFQVMCFRLKDIFGNRFYEP